MQEASTPSPGFGTAFDLPRQALGARLARLDSFGTACPSSLLPGSPLGAGLGEAPCPPNPSRRQSRPASESDMAPSESAPWRAPIGSRAADAVGGPRRVVLVWMCGAMSVRAKTRLACRACGRGPSRRQLSWLLAPLLALRLRVFSDCILGRLGQGEGRTHFRNNNSSFLFDQT